VLFEVNKSVDESLKPIFKLLRGFAALGRCSDIPRVAPVKAKAGRMYFVNAIAR